MSNALFLCVVADPVARARRSSSTSPMRSPRYFHNLSNCLSRLYWYRAMNNTKLRVPLASRTSSLFVVASICAKTFVPRSMAHALSVATSQAFSMPLRPFPHAFRVGTDICSVRRICQLLEKQRHDQPYLQKFVKRVFTHPERAYFWNRFGPQHAVFDKIDVVSEYIAGRYAASAKHPGSC